MYKLTLLILIVFLSCGKGENQPKDKTTDKHQDKTQMPDKTSPKSDYTLNGYQTIIDSNPKMEYIFGNNYKNWKPDNSDIEAAEKLLKIGFDAQSKPTVNRLAGRTLDEYYRQFVGAANEKGDKIIWINCFCKKEADTFKNWKTQIVSVADGGNCFFNATVNITKNTWDALQVNGTP